MFTATGFEFRLEALGFVLKVGVGRKWDFKLCADPGVRVG